jgi:hypothetical protein
LIHCIGLGDQYDTVALAVTTDEDEALKFANLVDLDHACAALLGLFDHFFARTLLGLIVSFGRYAPEVRMVAGFQPAT